MLLQLFSLHLGLPLVQQLQGGNGRQIVQI
jgi:hypothetical protein